LCWQSPGRRRQLRHCLLGRIDEHRLVLTDLISTVAALFLVV